MVDDVEIASVLVCLINSLHAVGNVQALADTENYPALSSHGGVRY